jgi:hypothetical protein
LNKNTYHMHCPPTINALFKYFETPSYKYNNFAM